MQSTPLSHPFVIKLLPTQQPSTSTTLLDLIDLASVKQGTSRMRRSSREWLVIRHKLTEQLYERPYDLSLYIDRARTHTQLRYPDLAAGDAYRALLLTDEIRDETGEYHEEASLALAGHCREDARSSDQNERFPRVLDEETLKCYQILTSSLTECGCLRTAWDFCSRGLALYTDDTELLKGRDTIRRQGKQLLYKDVDCVNDDTGDIQPNDLPDQGSARREVYPWNTYEPDRFSQESLDFLNAEMAKVAPKLEVKATFLPFLQETPTTASNGPSHPPRKQLGVFAKEPLLPGETILRETSLLAVNNRLHDSLCDACSTRLPSTHPETLQIAPCPDCEDTYFCSTECLQRAMESYHPAVCGLDMEAAGKEVERNETSEALYLLLLARVFAMAETTGAHPLELTEVKYIWGDFTENVDELVWQNLDRASTSEEASTLYPTFPKSLPFTFHQNISLPLHLLQKMSLNPYLTLRTHDLWIHNTLLSKFRGTASARLSPLDCTAEASAVHPMWCLANHDCDPNVQWEWGGEIRFWVRGRRVGGRAGGVGTGEEIRGHYCDVGLGVRERREWAVGSLGGLCMCERCRREEAEEAARGGKAA
ncbi:MAG: hypothetical protein M1839_001329 [Geoglossum umbratile]|nr:MAG: hypothetical protein M1839_001329 [Geoglossum umbratile]